MAVYNYQPDKATRNKLITIAIMLVLFIIFMCIFGEQTPEEVFGIDGESTPTEQIESTEE